MMHDVFLLLGGNLGDVPGTFKKALSLMQEAGFQVKALSSLYQTEAWGKEVKGLFFNQAVGIQTSVDPMQLLSVLNKIELSLGRKRITGVVDSRTVDIDILLYDDIVVSLPELVIPHPRLHLRKFALTPLSEIAPELMHPLLHQTILQLLYNVSDTLFVKKTGSTTTLQAAITE